MLKGVSDFLLASTVTATEPGDRACVKDKERDYYLPFNINADVNPLTHSWNDQ